MTNTPKRIGLVSNGLGGWRLWSKDEPGMGGRDHPDAEYILLSEHDRIVAAKDAEIARLREALTPSAETKAAYWSEVECDCPTETWRHYVPWTSIKQIMKMIRARAALKGDSDE